MKSFGCIILTVIAVAFVTMVTATLQWLFEIEPAHTISGILVIVMIVFLRAIWYALTIAPRRMQIILQILAVDGEEMTALEILEQGQGELKRGSIYGELAHLEETGMITRRVEERTEPYLPRHYYKITPSGRRNRFRKVTKLKLRHVFSYTGHSKSGFFCPVDFQKFIYYN